MLKQTIVALALGFTVSASAQVSPFVGVERETKADVTFGYVGVDAVAEGVNITGMAKFNAKSADSAGDSIGYKLMGSYSLSKSLSIYSDTDFSNNFKTTESKVGVKLSF